VGHKGDQEPGETNEKGHQALGVHLSSNSIRGKKMGRGYVEGEGDLGGPLDRAKLPGLNLKPLQTHG